MLLMLMIHNFHEMLKTLSFKDISFFIAVGTVYSSKGLYKTRFSKQLTTGYDDYVCD